jgi:hypothetical protein
MRYEPSNADMDRDENNISHHVPHDDQADRYQDNRDRAINLATSLRGNCPPSRELSIALTKLEEVVFWANASIARNEG